MKSGVTKGGVSSRERAGLSVLVGILGGMGPAATVDFYSKLIAFTDATCDQDHLPVAIWANPGVPDRSEALLGGGADPTPQLVTGALALEGLGASFIVVPCNTAHAFLAPVEIAVGIPILNIVEETVAHLRSSLPAGSHVGILATTGTIATGLYQNALTRAGLIPEIPSVDHQVDNVMDAIRRIKAGERAGVATESLVAAAQALSDRGSDILISACTEIPLVLDDTLSAVPIIDSSTVLARATVAMAVHCRCRVTLE